jgi:ubiquitin-protein ligase
MWSADQRTRMVLEHQALQREGFEQFSVYHDRSYDIYWASGTQRTSSGGHYRLHLPIPAGYPYQRPPLFVTEPYRLRTYEGSMVSSLGISHAMHTLSPNSSGHVQICHWREDRWHSGIMLHRVFLKGMIWIEAYEQHLATGHPISEFVKTMA